jgi:diguanylate cyclase (GGDEF)-like protein
LYLSAGVWGATALVTPGEPLLYLGITFAFLIGLAGAALPAYGVFMYMAVGAIGALLLPILTIFLLRGEITTTLLAISGIWFFLTSLRAVSIHNASVTQSFRLGHELRGANLASARLADTDGLTGLYNRRAFHNAAAALLELAAREQRPATIMLIDIDNFKQINDQHGHSAGDAALVRLATTLTRQLRGSDLCARVGGDEFAVLLPNTTEATARDVAEKLRVALQSSDLEPTTVGVLSLSIGLAEGSALVEPLLHRADAAMYEAKRSGKGRVVVAPPSA